MAVLEDLNAELDEKRKKALKDHYEAATKLEDAQGLIVKLTAQFVSDVTYGRSRHLLG